MARAFISRLYTFLGVDVDFLFSAHGPEHIHGQCCQLVLAGIDEYRGEETQSAAQSFGDVLAMAM